MNDWLQLAGKTAIITGAGSGIGRAAAIMLAGQGVHVLSTDRDGDSAAETATAVREAGGQAMHCPLDVLDDGAMTEAVRLVTEEWGGLHLAINSAGIGSNGKRVGEIDLADWDQVIGVDLTGVLIGMNRQIPAMIAAGGGAVVNIASIAGIQGATSNAAYVAAKHAVIGITKTAALEWGRSGVRVNAIGPGYIETPMCRNVPQSFREVSAARAALGRWGTAEEVAGLATFLLSDRASYITGSYHLCDGGATAGTAGALENG